MVTKHRNGVVRLGGPPQSKERGNGTVSEFAARMVRLPSRTALLKFSGDYKGVEVRVKLDVPLGFFMDFQDAAAGDKTFAVYEMFAREVLVDWNLEDAAGKPIQANAEGIRKIPSALAIQMMNEWSTHVTATPAPLGGT